MDIRKNKLVKDMFNTVKNTRIKNIRLEDLKTINIIENYQEDCAGSFGNKILYWGFANITENKSLGGWGRYWSEEILRENRNLPENHSFLMDVNRDYWIDTTSPYSPGYMDNYVFINERGEVNETDRSQNPNFNNKYFKNHKGDTFVLYIEEEYSFSYRDPISEKGTLYIIK